MAKTKDTYKETLGKFAFGVFLFAVWIFLCASVLSCSPSDLPDKIVYSETEEINNLAGRPGAWCACVIFRTFGFAGYFLVIALGVGVMTYWRQGGVREPILKTVGFVLILTAASGASSYIFADSVGVPAIGPGGCAGALVKYLLERYCVRFGAFLALLSVFAAGGILASNDATLRFVLWSTGLGSVFRWLTSPFRRRINEVRPEDGKGGEILVGLGVGRSDASDSAVPRDLKDWPKTANRVNLPEPAAFSNVRPSFVNFANGAPVSGMRNVEPNENVGALASAAPNVSRGDSKISENVAKDGFSESAECAGDWRFRENPVPDSSVGLASEPTKEPESESESPKPSFLAQAFGWGAKKKNVEPPPEPDEPPVSSVAPSSGTFESRAEYVYPSLDLLTPRENYDPEAFREKILARGVELERVFKSYGVEVKVVDVQTGPVLTLYEIELKAGLRVKNIHALTNDLEIAMKAPRVRIVSPIPGKNTVGVELPNETRQLVRLREVMEERADAIEKMAIPIFLGKDVVGAPMVEDLATMPHLLIAGRTGTGKSVCLNSIIMSILATRSPSDVKLILIDPKMVELSPYRSIPHLMHPVVVDMNKAEAILEWAVEKMEDRYRIFAKVGARKLSEFNKMSRETLRRRLRPQNEEEWAAFPKTMPSVVVVADEMADLVMTSGKDVERHIARLAQKSRAVGIHLVLATQKPTVDVVTGLIKSNLPARIAFGVASRTDSQVVLDAKGAEQLLGNGDMLFLQPGTSRLVRGQGTFVSDSEIDAVIDAISVDEPEFEIVIDDEVEAGDDSDPNEIEYDEYYIAAVDACIAEGRASTSLLQRKFSIGYNRAARIIDAMTAEGIVTPHNPAKPSRPRDVLITMEQWRGRQDGGKKTENFEFAGSAGDGGENYSTDDPRFASASSRRTEPTVNFGAYSQNSVVDFAAARAASNLVPNAAAGTSAPTYRSGSYEATPISTPESRAAEREAAARTNYREIDLSPRRSDDASGGFVADPSQNSASDASREGAEDPAAEPPKNGGWNDAQWAKYLDYDAELNGDSDDAAADDADFDSEYSVGNLREAAKKRRERRS